MAQRKPPSPPAKKPGARANSKGTTKAPARTTTARPPARKPGKSIVNQKQTPWGLIITTVVLVVFAAAIVIYAVTRSGGKSSSSDAANKGYVHAEIAAAKAIPGVIYKAEPNPGHVPGTVKYDTSPPIGGDHSGVWADCNGTV